MHQVKQFNY